MMKKHGASGHFQTVRTDFAKPQTPWNPAVPAIEEPPATQRMEPIRVILPKPKKSKFQKH
jgi:hypothetical protein